MRQHASEIFPCLRVRHDRLAAAERHCAVRLIHVPRIRAGLLRLKPLQVVAEACGNIVIPRAMSWSDAETKVGHLSPWETCKAFAFYTALQAISKQLGQPAYALFWAKTCIAHNSTDKQKAERRLVLAALHWTCLCTETPGIHGAPHWTCLCT